MRIERIAVVSFIYGLCSCTKANRRLSIRVVQSASSHRRRAGSAALGCAMVDRFWQQFGDGVRWPPHPQRCRCCICPRGGGVHEPNGQKQDAPLRSALQAALSCAQRRAQGSSSYCREVLGNN
ncbi:hypothetical protein PVAP13_5NG025608 [Panicum virgatum]|uniref:Uncharacterized protein n=1 Tax=Panicum virgatum TaxID=38727 RepID=A0A8T0RJ75_PANVG|nr:hypothetical protein PVAP13_5NG025608 [Panicum virgatum]